MCVPVIGGMAVVLVDGLMALTCAGFCTDRESWVAHLLVGSRVPQQYLSVTLMHVVMQTNE